MQTPASQPARNAEITGSVAQRKPTPAAGNIVHVIAPGETLMKLTRQYGKSLSEIAKANNIPPQTRVKVGDRIVIPGTRATRIAAPAQPKMRVAAPKPAAPSAPPQPAQHRPAPPPKFAAASQAALPQVPATETARVVTPAAHHPEPEQIKREPAHAIPSFRWPVRGRVITAFGPRPSGQQNDGINLAVPEGTPVKAAEDGVVAYAGNELKTYGNLVLVRHSNGYVTAYAHASEILVKRDDPVKRGQVIAKSGQTGSVAAPQLHFEIRKGSTPVDPVPFLDKGGST
jgi:murein DD-endopeptidase MepM/ murein hydrolase activator NlpD